MWHQNCYHTRIQYPGHKRSWICDECALQPSEEKLEVEAEQAAQAERAGGLKRRKAQTTDKYAYKPVTRVSGQAKPGMKITDPRESHLAEGTWSTKHTHGGGKGSKQQEQTGAASAFTVGQEILAKWKRTHGWYDAVIQQINDDGTYWLLYDDGDEDKCVIARDIKTVDM